MTLPRAFDLMSAWGKSPPVHWMMAAKFGFMQKEDDKQDKTEAQKEADWEALAAAMGTTIRKGRPSEFPES